MGLFSHICRRDIPLYKSSIGTSEGDVMQKSMQNNEWTHNCGIRVNNYYYVFINFPEILTEDNVFSLLYLQVYPQWNHPKPRQVYSYSSSSIVADIVERHYDSNAYHLLILAPVSCYTTIIAHDSCAVRNTAPVHVHLYLYRSMYR